MKTVAEQIESRIEALMRQMTLAEKVGQMFQANIGEPMIRDEIAEDLRAGRIGAVINVVDVDTINELQRIAVEESRLGIPLLVGRDVIHGFNTVMPIPLGQAASWNPELVREAAAVAAAEAAGCGINWTFAPMIDIARDPRWGRIAESFGEDPYLTACLGVAMVQGFQSDDLQAPGRIAACAKHFVGYGASEAGRDYSATDIPHNELRNIYLPPFRAAIEAGVLSIMTSFSDIDGIPATANAELVNGVLRDEWGFDGVVVSDWDAVRQLAVHGLTANDCESAEAAVNAGIDMEMFGEAYRQQLPELVEAGKLATAVIDRAVANILRMKFRLGLFENAVTRPSEQTIPDKALETARQAALESVVLLKNDHDVLPLHESDIANVAVIGPMADAPYEQLGTWIFDGDRERSITPLAALRERLKGRGRVLYHPALKTTRSRDSGDFDDAKALVADADVALLFLGEESILSGEAHSRADIDLPGAQVELVRQLRQTGKPIVAVILAGRPLTLGNIVDEVDALLYAWHPGSMAGPALSELLFGDVSPSGKLPVSFPRMVGQVPIHYNHKNTGRPADADSVVHIDAIEVEAPQVSLGMTAFHLDAGYKPLFPFGFGLSYSRFEYSDIQFERQQVAMGEPVKVSAQLKNVGAVAALEIAQLYVRDRVGSITRPVRELKGFQRVFLQPGEQRCLQFTLGEDDLAFFGGRRCVAAEPGEFQLWIGGSSDAQLSASFWLE